MSQEYIIRGAKKGGTWKNSYGEFQSYALALKGVGEPVKLNKTLPVQDEPKEGDVLYGHLLQERSGDGREYYLFKSDPRPEADMRQIDIHAQVALKLAVEVWEAQGCDPTAYDNIETEAVHFAKMINRIKKELL